jgi:hypothetical protein
MVLPLLVILASWILVLAIVAGLCLSARRGDLEQLGGASADPASESLEPALVSLQLSTEPAFDSPQIAAATLASAPRITAQTAWPDRRVRPCNPLGATGSSAG